MAYKSGDFVELIRDAREQFMVIQTRFDGWMYDDDGSYSQYTVICEDKDGKIVEKNPDDIRYAHHAERWGQINN